MKVRGLCGAGRVCKGEEARGATPVGLCHDPCLRAQGIKIIRAGGGYISATEGDPCNLLFLIKQAYCFPSPGLYQVPK